MWVATYTNLFGVDDFEQTKTPTNYLNKAEIIEKIIFLDLCHSFNRIRPGDYRQFLECWLL